MGKKNKAVMATEVLPVETTPKNPGGRPRKEIDEVLLKKMAFSAMTVDQIADACNCHPDTLYANYSEILREGRSTRKTLLAEAMWKNALNKDNVQMQIWLAKQHLGHKESQPESAQQINFNVIVNEVPK